MTIHIDFPDGSFQLFAGVLLICVAYFGYLFECLIEEKKIRFWDLNGNAKAKILGILTGAAYLIINGLIKVIPIFGITTGSASLLYNCVSP